MKMKPEDRQRWTDALRSGEFDQGEGCLRQETAQGVDRYCCLGVYAEVSGLSSRMIRFIDGRCAYKYAFPSADAEGIEVEEHAVIPRIWGDAQGISGDSMSELVRMNDTDGQSFHQIAEWIDANL